MYPYVKCAGRLSPRRCLLSVVIGIIVVSIGFLSDAGLITAQPERADGPYVSHPSLQSPGTDRNADREAAQPQYRNCTEPPVGMMAWYPADDGTPTDLLGQHHGSYVGAVGTSPDSMVGGGALECHPPDTYVQVPDHPDLNFGTGDFTIDMWVKTTAATGVQSLVDKRVPHGPSSAVGYTVFLYNGALAVQLADSSGHLNYISTLQVADGDWHFLGVSIDRDEPDGGTWCVDFSNVSFSPLGRQGNLDNSADLWIGATKPIPSMQVFDGLIDELEFFSRALTPVELDAIYLAGSEGKCKSAYLCYADLDIDGDGTIAVADAIYLEQFVNAQGPPPAPLFRADLNADGFIDYGDVVMMQCYLTNGMACFPEYPVPVNCNPDTVRGACCEGPDCHMRAEANCDREDGLYYGDTSHCSRTSCIAPLGCPEYQNLVENGGFAQGASAGVMPVGQSLHWGRAYGTPSAPEVFVGEGCEDIVYVELEGNDSTGSAIYQVLSTPIQAGRVYELQMCVRVSAGSPLDYANLRTIAFNGTLPTDGAHPLKRFEYPPSPDIAIMDVSGRIPFCGEEWTTYITQRWRAQRDFDNIAINVENNEKTLSSIVDIDNICLHEVDDFIPCYLADMDTLGNLIYPDSLFCPPMIQDSVEIFMGSVSNLYSLCGAETGVDTFYAHPDCPDSCSSIGGTIPAEILDFDLDALIRDSLLQHGLPERWEDLLDSLIAVKDSLTRIDWNPLDTLLSLGAIAPLCDSLNTMGDRPDPSSPFQGLDIVYVHGLRLGPLCDRIAGEAKAERRWGVPADRQEFTDVGGYWKDSANAGWEDHIQEYLGFGVDEFGFGTGNQNRFLVISHPVTQVGVVGAHAMLWQIREAMRPAMTGVRGSNIPTHRFGENGFVIISHSCGALISNLAMSLAAKTKTNVLLRTMLGPLDDISDRCVLNVSLTGANVGSNLAVLEELALLGGSVIPELDELTIADMCDNLPSGTHITDPDVRWDLVFSQLLDMAIPHYLYGENAPQSLQAVWGTPMKDVPMHVLTLTGGHPSEYGKVNPYKPRETWKQMLGKHVVHHGFDDGVLSGQSASANADQRIHYPSKYLARPGLLTWVATGIFSDPTYTGLLNERVFDMGIDLKRATGYYLDQKLDVLTSSTARGLLGLGGPCGSVIPPTVPLLIPPMTECHWTAAGSIPWLSPTGMVQPVLWPYFRIEGEPGYDALNRLDPKFHSFIQSSTDHYGGAKKLGDVNPAYRCYYSTPPDGPGVKLNYEEVRVTTENVYHKAGGPGLVSDDMIDLQSETIRGKKIQFCTKFKIFGKKWCTPPVWIWKRKYHQLMDSSPGGVCGPHQLNYVYKYVLKP